MSVIGQLIRGASAQPDDFKSVTEFMLWYAAAGAPMVIPVDAEIYRTDDAVAICVFRAGRYQAELYVVDDITQVPMHEHPGLDLIMVDLKNRTGSDAADGWPSAWQFDTSEFLSRGNAHGGGNNVPDGQNANVFLVCTRWPKQAKPHTASAVWKGKTLGPKHTALIKRFFPNAYEKDGYVDITRVNSNG